MEKDQRKLSGRSSKSGRKDGKIVKSQTAAQETQRREALRETLRDKLDLEKRALQVVERLLEDSVAEDFFLDCACFITTTNYKDTVEERSIMKLCGYPICPNKLGKVPTQRYKISMKTNKVYDITERKCFCSNFCYKASKSYELQISKTPLWLRKEERPPDVTLMKKGDGGSSGEEVRLANRRLGEEDVENPLPLDLVAPGGPRHSPTPGLSHSDSSDSEQDFVSSVVSQRPGARVHWGELPKRTDKGKEREQEERERRDRVQREKEKDTEEFQQVQTIDIEERREMEVGNRENERGQNKENTESQKSQTERSVDTNSHQQHTTDTNNPSVQHPPLEERGSPEGQSMEEARDLLNHCTIEDRKTATVTSSVHGDPTSTQGRTQEGDPAPSTTSLEDAAPEQPTQPGLNITQVGMSRRGAVGLIKGQGTGAKPGTIRLNLLEGLRCTLNEWRTNETLKFLYGPDHASCTPLKIGGKEEELDEDDLEDIVGVEERETWSLGRPSAPAPDYNTLCRETEEMGLRVREFYKGRCVFPGEVKQDGDREDHGGKDPVLPLIDSHAQNLIQKRITVEKLTRSLRDIIGPLRLTMIDVSSDLNNLVRTFRFTNTNIIHKTHEWTLIAIVLLYMLSEVSPVVREALGSPASVEYLSTYLQELTLKDQDLQSLVQLLRTPAL